MSKTLRAKAKAHVARLLARDAADHKAEHKLLHAAMRDMARRVTVGNRARKALTAAMPEEASMQYQKLIALHEADYRACRRQLEMRRRAVRALMAERTGRQRALLKQVLKHRDRFEYGAGNPITKVCDWDASPVPSSTVESSILNAGVVTIHPGPQGTNTPLGTNRVTMAANCTSASAGDWATATIRSTFAYNATAPTSGILTVTGSLAPIGSYEVVGKGGCVGHGFGRFNLQARVNVSVVSSVGTTFDLPNGSWQTISEKETRADCESDSDSGAFNFETELFNIARNRIINVVAGDEMIARVQYRLEASVGRGGVADVDLAARDSGLYVPVVTFAIES